MPGKVIQSFSVCTFPSYLLQKCIPSDYELTEGHRVLWTRIWSKLIHILLVQAATVAVLPALPPLVRAIATAVPVPPLSCPPWVRPTRFMCLSWTGGGVVLVETGFDALCTCSSYCGLDGCSSPIPVLSGLSLRISSPLFTTYYLRSLTGRQIGSID